MNRVAELSAWYLVVIGFGHALATPYFHSAFTEQAIWFAVGGLCFASVGLVNLTVIRWAFRERTFCSLALVLNLGLVLTSAALSYELWFHVPALLVLASAVLGAAALLKLRSACGSL
jgi:hypothetical protein